MNTEGQPSGLTDKEERFAEEYLVDLNATQAAIRAGYEPESAGKTGHKVRKKAEVDARIQRGKHERTERTHISQDMVVIELWESYKVFSKLVPKIDFQGNQAIDKDGNPAWKMVDGNNAVSCLDKLMKHTGGYDADNRRNVDAEIFFGWKNAE